MSKGRKQPGASGVQFSPGYATHLVTVMTLHLVWTLGSSGGSLKGPSAQNTPHPVVSDSLEVEDWGVFRSLSHCPGTSFQLGQVSGTYRFSHSLWGHSRNGDRKHPILLSHSICPSFRNVLTFLLLKICKQNNFPKSPKVVVPLLCVGRGPLVARLSL